METTIDLIDRLRTTGKFLELDRMLHTMQHIRTRVCDKIKQNSDRGIYILQDNRNLNQVQENIALILKAKK